MKTWVLAIAASAYLGISVCSPARAWDDEGHRIVAFIAEHYMRPAALEQVDKILTDDENPLVDHDLAGAATWADHYLQSEQVAIAMRYDALKSWHYADLQVSRPNIPAACYGQQPLLSGTPAAEGPTDCVIDKIIQFTGELRNARTPPGERLLALKYLLNLVADAHQPLRVVEEHDDHGKLVSAAAPGLAPGTLYSYWDSAFVARLGDDPAVVAERLISGLKESDVRLWSSGSPQLWVLESHQLAIDRAYGPLIKIDARGRYVLSESDEAHGVDTVALQLARAGVRVAAILNDALAPLPPAQVNLKTPHGNPAAGRAFALATCGVCHLVAPDQLAPREFSIAPDFDVIAATDGITEDSLREFLYGPHPTMPSLILDGNRANDVIAYILSLRHSKR